MWETEKNIEYTEECNMHFEALFYFDFFKAKEFLLLLPVRVIMASITIFIELLCLALLQAFRRV